MAVRAGTGRMLLVSDIKRRIVGSCVVTIESFSNVAIEKVSEFNLRARVERVSDLPVSPGFHLSPVAAPSLLGCLRLAAHPAS